MNSQDLHTHSVWDDGQNTLEEMANAAVAANRTEIKFIGIAGDKDVLTYVTDGNPMWLGEVLQNPVDLGYQATKAMYETLVEGKELPLVWDLPMPEVITPANVADYAWQTWGWL